MQRLAVRERAIRRTIAIATSCQISISSRYIYNAETILFRICIWSSAAGDRRSSSLSDLI